MAKYAVASYNVVLGRIPWVGLGSDPDKWPVAGIRCRQQSSGAYLDIAFMPEGVPMPANTSSGNYHISYRPFSQFSAYIDILRNEAPIYMSLDAARPERHDISTAFEPVGEGD
jgi:hypothetical protein